MSQDHELRLVKILGNHPGRNRAIGAGALYERVYGEPWTDKIRDTRKLRELITKLRKEGLPICSVSDSEGGGYYLASAGSELEDYCKRLDRRALKMLAMSARIRKKSLPEMLGQMVQALAREK